MDTSDAVWAPQSPDLSSYHSADIDTQPVHPQHQGYRGSISLSSPTLIHRSLPGAPQPPPQQQHDHHHHHPPSAYMPRGQFKEEDAEYLPDSTHFSEKSIGKQPLNMDPSGAGAAAANGGLVAIDSVKISHHFPVARIKRIMQADDDVGKVAQVTPVVVSKALELFMVSLVTRAAAEAKARNSKRVGALHLKQAITKNEQFDFLNDIVSKVADAPAAGDKGDDGAMEVDGKKKKGAGRKKKKVDDDDF